MGKLKETNDSIYSSTLYSSTVSDYPSGLERPTFIGLVEIIRGFGFSSSDFELQFKEDAQQDTTTVDHFLEEPKFVQPDQLVFQEIS